MTLIRTRPAPRRVSLPWLSIFTESESTFQGCRENESTRKGEGEGLSRRTEGPCQNVWNGRENTGSGQVDGEISNADGGDSCKNNVSNGPYKGRDHEH